MALGCGGKPCGCSKLTEEGLEGILGLRGLGWTGTCSDPKLDGSIDDANAWTAACFSNSPTYVPPSVLYQAQGVPVPPAVQAAINNPSASVAAALAASLPATSAPNSLPNNIQDQLVSGVATASPIVSNPNYILYAGLALLGLAFFIEEA